jgi:Protein ENHANCED DISEASE RESISTANCE 2, C-terminal
MAYRVTDTTTHHEPHSLHNHLCLSYSQTDVDVASSRVTQGIVATCMMFADALAMDVGFVIEGREVRHLHYTILMLNTHELPFVTVA